MGWQDAPVVQAGGSGWQGAPLVDSPPAPKGNDVTGTAPDAKLAGGALNLVPGVVAGETALAMGSGMAGSALGGLAGIAGSVLPGAEGQGADWTRRVQQGLSYEPRTALAKGIVQAASLPGQAVSAVAHKVGERGAEVSPLLGTIGETSVEALPVLLGARAAQQPKKALTPAEQKVAGARDSGFVMTPEEMGAGPVARTAAGIAGEPRLAKAASKQNAALGTEKAKVELGIPKDATLDLDTLSNIRRAEANAYKAARGIGEVAIDAKYLADIDSLGAKYRSAAKDFPGLAKADIEQVISALKKEDPAIAAAQAQGIKLPAGTQQAAKFEANSAIDLMGQLRESADKAFRSGDNGLAKVYRGGAEALEAQIERHLAASGQTGVLDAFRAARERIAKTYAVEKALVGDMVNPQALGRQVEKRKPLTGGLKETGEFARNFDRSSQKPTHMPVGATIHDLALGILSGLRSQGGSLALDAITAGARPAARSALLSRPAQWAMDPRTNLSSGAQQALAISSALPPPQEKRP